MEKLIKGEDYREEIVNAINVAFLDFAVSFFKKIVEAKMNTTEINIDWYKKNFINNKELDAAERAILAGVNKKTVCNIYGSANKKILLDVANANLEYLTEIVDELKKEETENLDICLKISYKGITVELSLTESLLVINALATKKLAIRGGAWSSIGKKVEKPLVDELCRLCRVPSKNIDNKIFKKDGKLDYDREVDYKLIGQSGDIYKVEVKLMGKGNPESADAVIARDSKIFIADTLSEQNKSQLQALGVKYIELKNNCETLACFKKILKELDVPCE